MRIIYWIFTRISMSLFCFVLFDFSSSFREKRRFRQRYTGNLQSELKEMGSGMCNELESKFITNNGMLVTRLQFGEFESGNDASYK